MTQQQALDWITGGWRNSPYAKTENGLLGIDVDGQFGFQCVDFSTAYSIYLGSPFNGGKVLNAITLWTNPQPGWAHVGAPQPGDVFVKDYVGPDGVNYGHTGCVKAVGPSGFTSVDQNWFHSSLSQGSPPADVFHPFDGSIKGYLRWKGAGMSPGTVDNIYLSAFGRLATPAEHKQWDGTVYDAPDGIFYSGIKTQIETTRVAYEQLLADQSTASAKLDQVRQIVG